MEEKLRAYMEELFGQVAPTKQAVEMKEEILQNLVDKYHDLLEEGKSPEAAYNIAVASIGDTDELLSVFRGKSGGDLGAKDAERRRRGDALRVTAAVMLYILSVVPLIVLEATRPEYEDSIGVALMFVMIAAGTGLLIYNGMTKSRYQKKEDSIVEEFKEFKEWKTQSSPSRQAMRAINGAVWSLAVVAYIVVSFATGAWHITWVIFLIAVALEGIVKAVFELKS